MDAVMLSLDLMWKGMVSIFVVIGLIFVVTLIITRNRKKQEPAQETPAGEEGSNAKGRQ